MAGTGMTLDDLVRAHQAGDYARAIAGYEAILRSDPNHHAVLHLCGLALLQSGQSNAAKERLARACALQPDIVEYHLNHGAACEAEEDLLAAADAYERGLQLTPNDPDVTFNLGLVRLRKGEFAEAASRFAAVLDHAPSDAEARENLARAQFALGQWAEATTNASAVTDKRPHSANALLGDIASSRRAYREAATYYESALRGRPNEAGWWTNLGSAYRQLDEVARARAAYEKALAIEAQKPEALFNLGTLEEEQGREAQALRYLREAFALRVPGAAERVAGLLARAYPTGDDAQMRNLLLALYSDGQVDVQQLAAATAAQLRARWRLGDVGATVNDRATEWLSDPLAIQLLTQTINVDAALETHLCMARKALVARVVQWSDAEREQAAAIALQCFYNEFAWATQAEERSDVAYLESDASLDAVLAFAMYRPLVDSEWTPSSQARVRS